MLITDNKSTFYSTLLGRGERVLQKSTLYAFINVETHKTHWHTCSLLLNFTQSLCAMVIK